MSNLVRVLRTAIILCVVSPVLSFILGPRSAYGYGLYIVYGASMGNAVFAPAQTFTTTFHSLAYGEGLLFDFRLAQQVEIEMGMFYMPRGYGMTETGVDPMETTFSAIEVPIFLQIRPLPFFVMGVGGYYSRGLGSVKTHPVSDPKLATAEAFGVTLKAEDYGAALGLGIHCGIIPYLDIYARVNYLLSMQSSYVTSGTNLILNDLQFFLGVKLGGGYR